MSVAATMVLDLKAVLGILIAALGGAAVGLEREWSGHTSGPHAHFAGIRTFTLLGLEAGLAGWLWANGQHALALVLVAGAAILIVAAYVAASRADVDGTTEVAALVVLSAGVLSGMQELRLGSAVIALTTLLLVEKSRLHGLVKRMDDAALRAGVRFAVMAVVILPLLPQGPYGPWGGVRPRQLWLLVLFFSGMSFAGYIARRVVGSHRGYPIAGMLGGIVSSTNVTLSFARTSRAEPGSAMPLAMGVIAASAVMCVRIMVATAVLNPAAAKALAPYLLAPFLLAALIAWWGITKYHGPVAAEALPLNPLKFVSALQMAVLFQAVLFAVRWAQVTWGHTGVRVSAGVLGLTDVDALVISMAKQAPAEMSAALAAQAIAIGALANTVLKLGVGVAIGRGEFRRLVGLGLAGVALAFAIALVWLR